MLDAMLAATSFEGLDWAVLGLFAVAMVGIIVWVTRKKEETSDDYFLAGRDAGWLAIGASIFASNIGSEHLIGLAGAGAKSGMAMAHWEIQAWMILILGWAFVPFYSRSMVLTMPEFLERRYNPQSRTILSFISLISYVLTKVAVTVYAGGLVFKEVFKIETLWGIDFFWISAIGLVLITAVYTVLGGMKSVLYTSVLQTPILLLGSLVILVLGLQKLGGWEQMMDVVRATPVNEHSDTMANLIRSNSDPEFPWLGVLLGSSIIGFWYWCTDQFIVQRVLSGKDQQQARRGAIFGAYLKLTPVFLFLIPGMIAFAMAKNHIEINGVPFELSEPDAAFPNLVAQLLPAGIKGVVVCGILAALMSSLASLFNSSAMLFTIDFYQKFKPETPQDKLVTVGRIATVVIVVLGILWIPVMKSIGKVLYTYLQDVQSVLAPGIAAAFLMGILWKRASAMGGMWGLLSGMIIGLTRLGAKVYYTTTAKHAGFIGADGNGDVASWSNATNTSNWFLHYFYEVNWLFFCGGMFIACILIVIIVSLITQAPDPDKIKGLVMGTASDEQKAETRNSWNQWDLLHTAIILVVTVVFYWYFW